MIRSARHLVSCVAAPLAVAGVLTAIASPAAAGEAKPRTDRALTKRLDAAFERAAPAAGDPGVQAVALRNGRLLWSASRGIAVISPRRRVDAATHFSYASFGKLLLGSYALHQVELRRLDLDAPIAAYVGDDVAGSDVVTARMLLSHTSGYPSTSPETDALFGKQYDPNRRWTFAMLAAGIHDPVEPGQHWDYSNTGFRVLAHVLSKTADKPLERAFMEFIRPAGSVQRIDERVLTMRRSRDAAKRIAHGYSVRRDGSVADSFAGAKGIPTDLSGLPFGDGAFSGTALGAAQVLDGLLVRKKLLRPATVRQMIVPSRQGLAVGEHYGMAIERFRASRRAWYGHTGTFGGFTTKGATDIERGVTIVVVANREPADGHPGRDIWKALVGAYTRGAR